VPQATRCSPAECCTKSHKAARPPRLGVSTAARALAGRPLEARLKQLSLITSCAAALRCRRLSQVCSQHARRRRALQPKLFKQLADARTVGFVLSGDLLGGSRHIMMQLRCPMIQGSARYCRYRVPRCIRDEQKSGTTAPSPTRETFRRFARVMDSHAVASDYRLVRIDNVATDRCAGSVPGFDQSFEQIAQAEVAHPQSP
jgi:hypothetical protein